MATKFKYIFHLFRLVELFSRKWFNPFQTLFFNFYFLPLRQAVHFPFFIYGNLRIAKMGGVISIDNQRISSGMVRLNVSNLSASHFGGNTEFRIFKGSSIIFKGRTRIGGGCLFGVDNKGSIVFGDDVIVHNQNNIYASGKTIRLGDRVTIGHQNQIYNTNFHFTIASDSMEVPSISRDIELGENVWITNRVTILRGVHLAANIIVCSNSLVTKSVKEQGVMIGGIPAKQLSQNCYPIMNDEAASRLNHYFNSFPDSLHTTWHGELADLISAR